MIYIKTHYPRSRYETTFLSLWEWMYHRNINISKPEHMAELLKSHNYTEQEIKDILAAASSPQYKEALTSNTQKALDRGAYGAPWFWVRNSEGREEPFFGSDRLVSLSFCSRFCVVMLMSVGLRICGSIWGCRFRMWLLLRRRSCKLDNCLRINAGLSYVKPIILQTILTRTKYIPTSLKSTTPKLTDS